MNAFMVRLLFLAFAAWAGDDAANPLQRELVEHGIEMAGAKQAVRLPAPSLPDGLDAKEQKQIIERLVSKKYTYDQFVRKSPVAPFLLEMNTQQEMPGKAARDAGRVQRVDLWFVAYGEMQTVNDRQLLSQLAGGNRSSQTRFEPLSDDALRKRDRSARDEEGYKENYTRIELPVLDKVQVSGIVHAATTQSRRSAVAAVLLDPTLTDDAEYPARWQSLGRGESGEPKLGEPQAYTGLAAYCRVCELQEPAGALWIECHLVFDEPHDWFNGANLLRSKLPLVVQDSVRSFRRKLVGAQ
ncbi:MAG TPA: hypothetical protein VFW87_20640 [Pirellulales bacterium]|nr:hypothetical protein [Pirellulales bacterium]